MGLKQVCCQKKTIVLGTDFGALTSGFRDFFSSVIFARTSHRKISRKRGRKSVSKHRIFQWKSRRSLHFLSLRLKTRPRVVSWFDSRISPALFLERKLDCNPRFFPWEGSLQLLQDIGDQQDFSHVSLPRGKIRMD